jgi:hypothetical protein
MRKRALDVIALTAGVLAMGVLGGCGATRGVPVRANPPAEAGCPQEIQGQVTVFAAAVPLSVPAQLAINVDSSEHPEKVGRRITISVAPTATTRGIKVFSSTATITTVGGTFAGWAAVNRRLGRAEAIEIIPGRLRLKPFLISSTLRAQTTAVDVLVTPGGTPIDEMAIDTSPMWSAALHPVRPEALQITLTPVRHLTVFDVVDATIQLELSAALPGSSGERAQCSFENRFELVDHDAVLPDLWGLRRTGRLGEKSRWLALNDPTNGPFRAIFGNPAAARSFAAWLRETRATEVSQYKLGLFQLEEPVGHSPPAARLLMASAFHEVSIDDLGVLEVRRLGEE